MPHIPTPAELIEIAYRFFPAGVPEDDPRFLGTPEQQRMTAARRAAVENREIWDVILSRLRATIPGATVDDWSFVLQAGHDASYQARISSPSTTPASARRDDVVVMVSFIAPVFFIYTSVATTAVRGPGCRRLFPSWIRRTRDTYAAAEAITRGTTGYSRPSAGTLFRILPDLQYGNRWFGDVRLVDCLFSAHRW